MDGSAQAAQDGATGERRMQLHAVRVEPHLAGAGRSGRMVGGRACWRAACVEMGPGRGAVGERGVAGPQGWTQPVEA
jgi:hypothetical protein